MTRLTVRSAILSLACVIVAAAPAWGQGGGYLKAKINPGRAGVFVDGKYVGPAANFRMARKYAVAAGDHEIRVVDPRYEEWTTKVRVESGKTATVSQALKALPVAKPPFGRLRVIANDKFSAVYLNGKFYGHAGELNNCSQGLLVNPGTYEVRVDTGGQPHTESVGVIAGKTVIVRADK